MQMIKIDTSALNQLNRALIGFDQIFEEFENRWSNSVQTNYPPHNVIKTGDDTVTIEVAVAGFAEGEIEIALDKRLLTIAGARKHAEDEKQDGRV